MPVLAPGIAWVDLKFRGSPNVIATAVINDAGGVALIDPGPTSSLIETLEALAEWVHASLLEQRSDEERARCYAKYVDRELKRHLTEEEILPHLVGAPFEVSWLGLARYWRKNGIGV